MEDKDCICIGNWRQLVKECEPLFNKKYMHAGLVYRFFGLVNGERDYYYGMYNKEDGMKLLSCVGSIEGHDFVLVEKETNEKPD